MQRADALLAEASQLDFSFEEVLQILEQRQASLDLAKGRVADAIGAGL